jgi:hypothetical protein
MKQKKARPVRDDRNGRLLVSREAQRPPAFVDRPVRVRDGLLFENANPALRTGLLSLSPPGQKSSPYDPSPYVDADGRLPDDAIIICETVQ